MTISNKIAKERKRFCKKENINFNEFCEKTKQEIKTVNLNENNILLGL